MYEVGIIARVATALASVNANIIDINQTVMKEYFTMIMLVDMTDMNITLDELKERLAVIEKDLGLSIRIQREEIFKKMHEI
jgi:ACT domain-containing protein